MPAAYAEPTRKNTVAHLAWSRGFTWSEWLKLGRGDRLIESLRAEGEEPSAKALATAEALNRGAKVVVR